MAVSGCVVQDMAGARVDVSAAITAATSLGVDPATAAPLIMAASTGMAEGMAEAREREKEGEGLVPTAHMPGSTLHGPVPQPK